MCRQLVSILFILAFAVQTFRQNFIVGIYYLNQALYAKNCENKTNPLLGCKGKCQVTKKLLQEEQKQAPAPGMKAEQKSESFSSLLYNTLLSTPEMDAQGCFGFAFSTGIPVNNSASIFHPPSLV